MRVAAQWPPAPRPGCSGRQPFLRTEPEMHRNVILAVAAVSLMGVTATAQAQQDRWTRQVNALLDQAASVATQNGLRRTHEPYLGALRQGASGSHSIELRGGVQEQIIGVCATH